MPVLQTRALEDSTVNQRCYTSSKPRPKARTNPHLHQVNLLWWDEVHPTKLSFSLLANVN